MSIRTLTVQDAAAVAELCGQLGYPTTASQAEERLRSLLSREDHCLLGAVRSDGRLLGWAHVHLAEAVQSDPHADLAGLVVDSSARGEGVGRSLVGAAERWALDRGLREMRVRSNVVRTGSHEFYRRLGYEQVKTSLQFARRLGAPD